jgi:hypothetical protein
MSPYFREKPTFFAKIVEKSASPYTLSHCSFHCFKHEAIQLPCSLSPSRTAGKNLFGNCCKQQFHKQLNSEASSMEISMETFRAFSQIFKHIRRLIKLFSA